MKQNNSKGIIRRALLVLLVFVPAFFALTCHFHIFRAKRNSCKVIYYSIPLYSTHLGKYNYQFLDMMDGVDDSRYPFGHAGVVLQDAEGNLVQYDYGRFRKGIYGTDITSAKGNFVRVNLGNHKGASGKELAKIIYEKGVAPRFSKNGGCVDIFILNVSPRRLERTKQFIKEYANNANRRHYKAFTDHSCCGVARIVFDHARRQPIRFISAVANWTGNVIPNFCHLWSCITTRGILGDLTGFSPEGDAPVIFTDRYRYKTDCNHK